MGSFIEEFDLVMRGMVQGLLNGLWQGGLIAFLVWVGLRFISRPSATTRHAVWFVCLLAIGVLSFLSAGRAGEREGSATGTEPVAIVGVGVGVGEDWLRQRQFEVNQLPDRAFGIGGAKGQLPGKNNGKDSNLMHQRLPEVDLRVSLNEPARTTGQAQAAAENSEGLRNRFRAGLENMMKGRLPMILAVCWMAIAVAMLLKILWSYSLLIRLRGRLTGSPQHHLEKTGRMAAELGIGREVKLFESFEVSMPMTIGAIKPIIILPVGLSDNLSEAEFTSVIAHELAHIRRWDYLTNFVQRLIEAVLWMNPVVWVIGRQMMVERELACDDWAVKTCGSRRYASCLTRLVEILSEGRRFAAASGILFGKHVITRRVEMILNRNRNATTAVSKRAIVYTIGLAVLFAVTCSLISPVIAVPVATKQAEKQQKKSEKQKTPPPAVRSTIPSPEAPPAPPRHHPPPGAPTPAAPPAEPGLAELPTPPLPPHAFVNEDDLEIAVSQDAPNVVLAPLAVPRIGGTVRSMPRASVAEGLTWQDEKKKEPAIPDSEMLSVLVDIVKRDSDPAVRNEALRGIYRMRSDAAINALIQLYDGTNDVKVRSEIIRYLGFNRSRKALDKLIQIAKNDSDPEIRKAAVRSLNAPDSQFYFNFPEGEFPRNGLTRNLAPLMELRGLEGPHFDTKQLEELREKMRIEMPKFKKDMQEFQKKFESEIKPRIEKEIEEKIKKEKQRSPA
ncbi:MAG: HEAT repeat domain-containing protein [Acidobacteria bacterium]|nr:HEAT repeat domain-containing protein [Acidobacteriota bacterium]